MNKIYDETIDIEKLKNIVNKFVDKMFDDVMIGFFFRKADRTRIKEKEFEFLADYLGFDVEYTGMTITEAHQKHPIMGGQFSRRKQILKEILEEFQVSEQVIESILQHTENFRMAVSKTRNSDCKPRAIS